MMIAETVGGSSCLYLYYWCISSECVCVEGGGGGQRYI